MAKTQNCRIIGTAPAPRLCVFAALCLFTAGCVPLPEETLKSMAAASPVTQATEPPYAGLAPGYKTYESAHFMVKAYSSETAVAYSVICEANYSRVMSDVGLYSFAPAKPYNIVVYKDADEYRKKTNQPEWSGGLSYGNAILVYESEGAAGTLAHEMTHLIFNEFMGPANSVNLKWINEGLAVYEETRASAASQAVYNQRLVSQVAPNPIPFAQMINLAPQSEQIGSVERWYAQAYSVVAYMINEGSTLGFSSFITSLKAGAATDAAIGDAFPNLWKKPGDLEKAWLLHIKS
ncbi:MAG: hypothetical protein WCW52_01510 [Elusimicrobiales bacterium]